MEPSRRAGLETHCRIIVDLGCRSCLFKQRFSHRFLLLELVNTIVSIHLLICLHIENTLHISRDHFSLTKNAANTCCNPSFIVPINLLIRASNLETYKVAGHWGLESWHAGMHPLGTGELACWPELSRDSAELSCGYDSYLASSLTCCIFFLFFFYILVSGP